MTSNSGRTKHKSALEPFLYSHPAMDKLDETACKPRTHTGTIPQGQQQQARVSDNVGCARGKTGHHEAGSVSGAGPMPAVHVLVFRDRRESEAQWERRECLPTTQTPNNPIQGDATYWSKFEKTSNSVIQYFPALPINPIFNRRIFDRSQRLERLWAIYG
jgi:hypothetical protein